VLTNNHVVEGCARMTARNTRDQRAPARIDATDPRRDLALLSVQPGFGPALAFRDAPPVQRGETVITYGFPLSGLLSSGPTLTTGAVSALAGLRDNPLHFQISAPVQPGNSGGPLLDAQGHVIGVVVSKLNAARIAQMTGGDIPQNVNFAIKGTEALAFLAAEGVQPRREPSTGPELRPADIGATADPATVFLQCFR
jgi:S1-C subfamily serine protease